jgi:hypothetical protein
MVLLNVWYYVFRVLHYFVSVTPTNAVSGFESWSTNQTGTIFAVNLTMLVLGALSNWRIPPDAIHEYISNGSP